MKFFSCSQSTARCNEQFDLLPASCICHIARAEHLNYAGTAVRAWG